MTDTGSTDPTPPPAGATDTADSRPWYKRPVVWTIIVILLAIGIGVLVYFLVRDDDDDATYSLVMIDRVDEAGEALDTEIVATVRATIEPESWRWVTPPDVDAPDPATATSNSSGTVTFRWGPTDDVEIREEWASTLTLTEELAPGETIAAASFDCTLRRGDEPERLVALDVVVETPDDPDAPSTVTYGFPNFEFLPADIMMCSVVDGVPGSTVPETSVPETSVPETTVPETTVPETTVPETTVPATTAPPATTVPPTTAPPATTVPPEVTTVMDAIEARDDLTTLVALIDVADLRDALTAADATITLFAPDDDAFEALLAGDTPPNVTDPAVVTELLLAHTNIEEVLLAADVLARTEVDVAFGGPQPVDVTDPAAPTIGGAGVVEVDIVADNGVIHVIDTVLPVQPEA